VLRRFCYDKEDSDCLLEQLWTDIEPSSRLGDSELPKASSAKKGDKKGETRSRAPAVSTRKGPAKTVAKAEKTKAPRTAPAPVKKQRATEGTSHRVLMSERGSRSLADQGSIIDDLAAEVRSDDEQVSLGAIERLGGIDDPRATTQLISCLRDSRYMVRILAAAQLGERRDTAAVEPLIGVLHDDSMFVRQTAAGALENIGGDKATAAVREAESERLLMDDLPPGKKLGPEGEE